MKGLVHPEAGARFFGSEKTHPVDFKLFADQIIQILSFSDDVAAIGFRPLVVDREPFAEIPVRLDLEERDLSLVILLVVEKAVPFDPATGDAFDFPTSMMGFSPGGLP